MNLEFEPIEFVDRTPVGTSWSEWVADLDRRPVSLTFWSGPEVHGFASRLRLGGVFVEPVESVVSLRSFSDSLEGTVRIEGVDEPVPYTLYDLEKVARMLLHDSGTALEILGAPAGVDWTPNRVAFGRRVVRRGATAGLATHYLEVARPTVEALVAGEPVGRLELLEGSRRLLTGVGLLDGRVEFDLSRLLDEYADDGLEEVLGGAEAPAPDSGAYAAVADRLGELRVRLEEAEGGVLSDEALDYDGLDEMIVEERLASREAS